jgi:conjugative transfer signal peptidase TraF
MVLAVLAVTWPVLSASVPVLVYNASASAPLGFYRLAPGAIRRGDFVLARLPAPVARFAAARGYLPLSVSLVKRVAAVPGDRVCAVSSAIHINNQTVALVLARDGQGRPLAAWQGCRTLADDEVFLLMAGVSSSFDGRYFGPIPNSALIGRLVPLWTW